MRVFYDEPSHQLLGKSFSVSRDATIHSIGFTEGGLYSAALPETSYRMYLYPFVVSLLNDLFGVRPENGFIVNVALLILFLIAAFKAGEILAPNSKSSGGIFLLLLLIGIPLLPFIANSAGYDMLNATLLLWFLVALQGYVSNRDSRSLDFSLILALMLSYSRSEGVLYLCVFAITFIYVSVREREIRVSVFAAISPLLLIGPVAGAVLAESFQGRFEQLYPEMNSASWFSSQFVLRNFKNICLWMTSVDLKNLNSIGLVFFFCLGLILFPIGKRVRSHDNLHFVLGAWVAGIVFHLLLILMLFWDPTTDEAVRFLMPISICTACLATFFWFRVVDASSQIRKPLIAAAIFVYWGFSLPASTSSFRTQKTGTIDRLSINWVLENLQDNTLFVQANNIPFLLYEIPTVPIVNLLGSPESLEILMESGVYDRVIVLEEWNVNTGGAMKPRNLSLTTSNDFIYKLIDTRRRFIHSELRIFEITDTKISLPDEFYQQEYAGGADYFNMIHQARLFRGR